MPKEQNPFGLHTITPYLVVDGVSTLIEFLRQVFGAESRGDVHYREDGSVKHAEVRIGDSVVMMGEPMDEIGPMPGMLYLYVDDCDATFKNALAAGAATVMEPDNYPHGDRYGGIKDPADQRLGRLNISGAARRWQSFGLEIPSGEVDCYDTQRSSGRAAVGSLLRQSKQYGAR